MGYETLMRCALLVENTSLTFLAEADVREINLQDILVDGNMKNDPEQAEVKLASLAEINKEPTSFEQAMASPERENWQRAVEAELEPMVRNQAWSLVDRPVAYGGNAKPNFVDSRWCLK